MSSSNFNANKRGNWTYVDAELLIFHWQLSFIWIFFFDGNVPQKAPDTREGTGYAYDHDTKSDLIPLIPAATVPETRLRSRHCGNDLCTEDGAWSVHHRSSEGTACTVFSYCP